MKISSMKFFTGTEFVIWGSSFQILNISLLESFVNLNQHLPTT